MKPDKDSLVSGLVGPARIELESTPVLPSYEEQLVRIQQHALWLMKKGHAESTIYGTTGCFKALAKDSDLMSPEDIKENIAFRPVTNATKEKLSPEILFMRQMQLCLQSPFAPLVRSLLKKRKSCY